MTNQTKFLYHLFLCPYRKYNELNRKKYVPEEQCYSFYIFFYFLMFRETQSGWKALCHKMCWKKWSKTFDQIAKLKACDRRCKIFLSFQIEKSQGEIYRLRAKLESTQTENENMQVRMVASCVGWSC